MFKQRARNYDESYIVLKLCCSEEEHLIQYHIFSVKEHENGYVLMVFLATPLCRGELQDMSYGRCVHSGDVVAFTHVRNRVSNSTFARQEPADILLYMFPKGEVVNTMQRTVWGPTCSFFTK